MKLYRMVGRGVGWGKGEMLCLKPNHNLNSEYAWNKIDRVLT